jgi:hypothetical protein
LNKKVFNQSINLTKKDLEDAVKSCKIDLTIINAKLDTLLAENTQLKKLVTDRDEKVSALKLQLNGLEQHNQACSVHMGLPLTAAEEKSSALARE